jgi:EmrB/QacA subfamily drug resistance transporter
VTTETTPPSHESTVTASTALAPAPIDGRGHPRRWAILAVLCAVAFMARLDFFIVNVALDGIGKDFPGSSLSVVSWVLSAYAIVFAAVLVPAGRIADLWGRKKVLLIGIGLFTLSSGLCALAPNVAVLIGGRAVQAVGAAMIVPTSLGLLYPNFPSRQHTLVVGIWAGVAAVAASAGPPVGGLLVGVSWRWIFVINLPIGIATIVAGLILIPEVRQPRGARLPDPSSVLSLLAAVCFLVLATVDGPSWGWGSGRIVALFALAALSVAITVQRTLRSPAPVIEKTLFRSRSFTAASVGLFLYLTGFSIFLLGTALFMQNVWHYSAVRAGLGIAPAPIVSIGFAVSAGPIQRRFGRTIPAVVGMSSMAVSGLWWFFVVQAHPAYWSEIFPAMVIMGFSGGLSQAPMYAAASTLPPERATTGSAVLNMSGQVGSAIGVSLLVALTATVDPLRGYDRAWVVQAGLGLAAAAFLIAIGTRRRTRATA